MTQNWPSWRREGVVEGALIRTIFVLLLGASGGILALDFRELLNRAGGEGNEQIMRIVFQPPTRTDQERPYFPRALPVLPGFESPIMPGMTQTPTPETVGSRMSFFAAANGDVSAVGRIEPGTAVDFDKFIDEAGSTAKTVWLLSPGGSVSDAMSIGRSIRKRGLNTAVADQGYCASSCPLAFAGGVERHAGRNALIGVHQIYAVPQGAETWHDGISTAQNISALCEEYLATMGVDPSSWIKAMRTPKERLYVFRTEELTAFRLTTAAASGMPARTNDRL